jgi:hypothetical protein
VCRLPLEFADFLLLIVGCLLEFADFLLVRPEGYEANDEGSGSRGSLEYAGPEFGVKAISFLGITINFSFFLGIFLRLPFRDLCIIGLNAANESEGLLTANFLLLTLVALGVLSLSEIEESLPFSDSCSAMAGRILNVSLLASVSVRSKSPIRSRVSVGVSGYTNSCSTLPTESAIFILGLPGIEAFFSRS